MKQRTRVLYSGDELTSNMNGSHDDIDVHSEIQLYRIKPQDHFIEAQVQEGDTLQAIALRFHCSISELKRINHIHKDNEIFARRTIKVPVTPYSVLTEIIPTAKPAEPVPSTSTSTSLNLENLLQSPVLNRIPQNNTATSNGSNTNEGDFSIDCNAVVLNSTLAPSVIPYTDTEQNELASEDTQLLPNKDKEPVEAVVVKQLTSQGADLGLKWFHLLAFVIVLGVFAPIIYVLFFLDKHEHSDVPPLHPTR
ncbi:lysM and putative peptidoglycan-binding domain-containing protein 3 isoform X2 [Maniola hyperantus]|uniref:lysM and putative peptidoglycan-binding domain-containing protein 3 isoform X2 n=1 Tax=Aphantopus hyperantus TaxID=2795564 RepID=UPI001568D7C4|nr:lysM and putative peptidoglycan-binding domain-containing protein 3 isoform X2 [Maniola hyperantus]